MTKEAKEAIHIEAAKNAGLHFNQQYSHDAYTGCISSFKSGVIWALSHPELMREEMEKAFVWSADNISPVRFFESNEVAMADIKRCAEEEIKLQDSKP